MMQDKNGNIRWMRRTRTFDYQIGQHPVRCKMDQNIAYVAAVGSSYQDGNLVVVKLSRTDGTDVKSALIIPKNGEIIKLEGMQVDKNPGNKASDSMIYVYGATRDT